MHFEKVKSAFLVLLLALTSNAFAGGADCNEILRAYHHLTVQIDVEEIPQLKKQLPKSTQARKAKATLLNLLARMALMTPVIHVDADFRPLEENDQILLQDYLAQLYQTKLPRYAQLPTREVQEILRAASRLLEAANVPHRVVYLNRFQDTLIIEPKANGSLLNQLANEVSSEGYQIGFSPYGGVYGYFSSELKLLGLPIESVFSPNVKNSTLAHEWVHLQNYRLIQKGKPPALAGFSVPIDSGRLPSYDGYSLEGYELHFSHEELAANLAGNAQLVQSIRALDLNSPLAEKLINKLTKETGRARIQSLWLERHILKITDESTKGSKLNFVIQNRVLHFEHRGTQSIDRFPSVFKVSDLDLNNPDQVSKEYHRMLRETFLAAREGSMQYRKFIEENRDLFERTKEGRQLLNEIR